VGRRSPGERVPPYSFVVRMLPHAGRRLSRGRLLIELIVQRLQTDAQFARRARLTAGVLGQGRLMGSEVFVLERWHSGGMAKERPPAPSTVVPHAIGGMAPDLGGFGPVRLTVAAGGCPPSAGPLPNRGGPGRGTVAVEIATALALAAMPLGGRANPKAVQHFRQTGDARQVDRLPAGTAPAQLKTAPSWTPSLRFASLKGGHGGNLRRCKVDRAAICVAAGWTRRQFASGRRRHLAACRRETRRLLLDSQNGRLYLNGCPQNRCAPGPAATGRPKAGGRRKKGNSRFRRRPGL
jgi:hypothetical protein